MASNEVISALNKLHSELDRLEPALKHVETAMQVTNVVKEIPTKHLELMSVLSELDKAFKGELVKLLAKEIEVIKKSNSEVTDNVSVLLEKLEGSLAKTDSLNSQIELFHNKVEKINFPERLDKIDSTVAGINIGLQNLQTVLLNISTATQELRSNLISEIQMSHTKNNSKLVIITIVAVVTAISSIATLIFVLIGR
jgi:hypothetical protein